MASNLKAWLKRATAVSDERAEALSTDNMAANAHRYPPAATASEAMESERDAIDDPAEGGGETTLR